ncbi:hypothetical protein AHMF7605_17105 [Adhaeribacter arboris]|uniref:Uncharacterized protein n=1 Tax=Adhaeribacter arboris TaxID=2072846 RepID=A0A2T2YHW3_9BACT|nr:hypothetical protein AHMF7605_17105 [Adhaeribacter arboris]
MRIVKRRRALYLLKQEEKVKIEIFNKGSFYFIDQLHPEGLTLACYIENQQKETFKVFVVF